MNCASRREARETQRNLKELSELSQKFSNNVLDDRKNFEYLITDETCISEMPENDRAVAQKKAEEK